MSTVAVKTVRSWKDLKLWPHQAAAIEKVTDYLKHFSAYLRAGLLPRSALVRMPTGTGKSGVIAVLACCLDTKSTVLVISPWAALRDQLADDIRERFWNKIGVNPAPWPKAVKELYPSNVRACLQQVEENKGTVLVCTIQTLQTIYREQWPDYMSMMRLVSLVIVDEGHREPAPEWAKAVRELRKPTVLVTATPYRNDHKMFDVDPRYAYVFTHQDAVQGRFIREVKFYEKAFPRSADKFVEVLCDFYHGDFQKLKPSGVNEARVIVRCDTRSEVDSVALCLQQKGEKVVAIHDRFSDSEEDLHHKHIPALEETDATFWVHQFKLIEGIDDPKFCLLAIYQPLRNARALVQQIGRILRNPGKKGNQVAYVFAHPDDRQPAYWNGYRKYEEIFNKYPEKYEPRQLFDTIIQIQPAFQYIEGDFRERFDFDKEDLYKQLAYPRSTNVYKVDTRFSVETLADTVRGEWERGDKDIRRTEKPDDNTRVHIYQTHHNSPILLRYALAEYSLGFTICHRYNQYLFFYDSGGGLSPYLTDNAQRVSPTVLERLFSGADARIQQIALVNSDVGKYTLRRRTLEAYSIANTAPGLADHAHFYATAQGYTRNDEGGQRRRYVGFVRAHVTDPSSVRYEYAEYIEWLHVLADILDSRGVKTLPVFNRYARDVPPPPDPTPANILFDLGGVMDEFEPIGKARQRSDQLVLSELCHSVKKKDRFTCVANSQRYTVKISYDEARQGYKLSSRELEDAFIRRDPQANLEESLIGYLNRTQAFRVVPETPGVIYSHSHFYEPRLPLWGKAPTEQFNLLQILYPADALAVAGTEKGDRCPNRSGWKKGSLFYLIDRLGCKDGLEPDLQGIDILVCDDMKTEVADFIAASTARRRVIFIHAKASQKARPLSASLFHEVCSQATKNLGWIHPYSADRPPNLDFWNGPWDGGQIGTVARRIRRGNGDSDSIWNAIREMICDPTASREVWIVLGQGFSCQKLKAERKKPKPRAEVVQVLFLLQSTWAAVSSVGATLRVYCSP